MHRQKGRGRRRGWQVTTTGRVTENGPWVTAGSSYRHFSHPPPSSISLVYSNSLSVVLCLLLFSPVLSHLFVASILSLLMAFYQFQCDAYCNDVSLSLFPSLLRPHPALSQSGCHAVVLNDRLSSHFSCKFWHPRDIKSQRELNPKLWKHIFLISGPSNCLWMYMSIILSLYCLKLFDSLND